MRKVGLILACLSMSACTHMASYEFEVNKLENSSIVIVDSRPQRDKLLTNPCQNDKGISKIADEHILPNKIDFLKDRLTKSGLFEDGVKLTLRRFNLGLIVPMSCAKNKSIAAAGALAGIGIQSFSNHQAPIEEGVYCDIYFTIKGRKHSSYTYVEAQSGIDKLMGITVGTSGLLNPIEKAVDHCIIEAISKSR